MSNPYKNSFDQLLDLGQPEVIDDGEVEFQNFMLSSAEEDLIAGKIPTAQPAADKVKVSQGQPLLPLPVQVPTTQTAAFWTLAYWAHYFRVDTNDVLYRISSTLLPQINYQDVIGDNPDLYGPFWV